MGSYFHTRNPFFGRPVQGSSFHHKIATLSHCHGTHCVVLKRRREQATLLAVANTSCSIPTNIMFSNLSSVVAPRDPAKKASHQAVPRSHELTSSYLLRLICIMCHYCWVRCHNTILMGDSVGKHLICLWLQICIYASHLSAPSGKLFFFFLPDSVSLHTLYSVCWVIFIMHGRDWHGYLLKVRRLGECDQDSD